MDSFYEIIFSDVSLSSEGDTQVRCPFPHYDPTSQEYYYENQPSAGVNLEKGVFNCFSCGRKGNEIQFIQKYMGLSYGKAKRFKNLLENSIDDKLGWEHHQKAEFKQKPAVYEMAKNINLSDKVIDDLDIGHSGRGGIDFPVFIFDQLVDIVTYRKDSNPKAIRNKGSESGMIIPYDTWRDSTKPTVITAGEKDMAIGRTFGLNTITITGGEGTIPKYFLNDFKNRKVYIIYDNDTSGQQGAKRLAVELKPYVATLKIIDLSNTCKEKGEDLYDYFIKYEKTKSDLANLIKTTEEFTEDDLEKEKEKQYPTMALIQASANDKIGKMVRSNVQISSVMDDHFQMPVAMTGEKVEVTQSQTKNNVELGSVSEWSFTEKNPKDMFYLIDSNLKEGKIKENQKTLLGVPKNEDGYKITIDTVEPVFKAYVKDLVTPESDINPSEMLAFSVGKKLEHGKKYTLTYKLVPHPMDGQKSVMVIYNIEEANDAITKFRLSEKQIEHLKVLKSEKPVKEAVQDNVERVKGMIGFNYNETLIKFIDFIFHSAFKINVSGRPVRGLIDGLLVGESRTGKSSTAEEFIKRYNVGEKVSLPTSSLASVIGGSDKHGSGGYFTRAGSLPLNHKGLVVLEELQKSRDPEILKKLTEIKSSGIAQIGRVTGKIDLPCMLRILSITNPKFEGTSHKPISSYPNGIEIITDLVGATEDIARFDMIGVSSETANKPLDFNQKFKEPFPDEYYQTRIQWIWSRNADDIEIPQNVTNHLQTISNRLNKEFPSHIQIFGTELWKKIIKIAVAVAGYTISTNETFEKIVVTEEHVTYAAEFLRSLYDNETFKFKEYVEEEMSYSEIDDDGISALQTLYNKNPVMIKHLENNSETSRNSLMSIATGEQKEANAFLNELVKSKFVRYEKHSIYPTQRFRKGLKHIDKKTHINKLGRMNIDGNSNDVV